MSFALIKIPFPENNKKSYLSESLCILGGAFVTHLQHRTKPYVGVMLPVTYHVNGHHVTAVPERSRELGCIPGL